MILLSLIPYTVLSVCCANGGSLACVKSALGVICPPILSNLLWLIY